MPDPIPPPHRREQIGLESGEQDGDIGPAAHAQKMLEPLQADGIRMADPFQSQHHVPHVFLFDAADDAIETPLEVGSRAEKELSLPGTERCSEGAPVVRSSSLLIGARLGGLSGDTPASGTARSR